MIIVCPSCKRKFKLPVDKVRTRTLKLKCSKCKSVFVQDLAELGALEGAVTTADEQARVAGLPSRPPPPPQPAPVPPAPRPVAAPPVPPAPRPVAAPPVPPAPPRPVPSPPPRSSAPPPRPALAGYEDYGGGESPEAGEHEEMLRLAAEAAARQAELERVEAEARAAIEAAERAREEATAEAEARAEEAVAEAEARAAAAAAAETDAGLDVDVDEEEPPDGRPAPAARPAGRNDGVLDMFGGSGSRSLPVPPGDDFLLLEDEEGTRGVPWTLWMPLTVVLFGVLFLGFVAARNDWSLDFSDFGRQVSRAFGRAEETDAECLALTPMLPAIVHGSDGQLVVVPGRLSAVCGRSISGVSVRCSLRDPGGRTWEAVARPVRSAGASSLDARNFEDRPTAEMRRRVSEEENPAGVVLADSTHEYWCLFPGVASADASATSFQATVEVVTR
jgi:predicted Zn finger-like uncharacterized protein